jgi:hypothetical protein
VGPVGLLNLYSHVAQQWIDLDVVGLPNVGAAALGPAARFRRRRGAESLLFNKICAHAMHMRSSMFVGEMMSMCGLVSAVINRQTRRGITLTPIKEKQ